MALSPGPGQGPVALAAAHLHAQHHQIAGTETRQAVQALPPLEGHCGVAVCCAEQAARDGRNSIGVPAATHCFLKGSPEVGRA
ncbi:hypothetical protein Q9R31_12010 [Pseudarthrobacter sp. BRE9]|nr:hypothetical protein [Pseudarthrobacter sp. BRE9]MDT0169768.1 hypothetical protein [Pseudarthrobacter sp. BRE9]